MTAPVLVSITVCGMGKRVHLLTGAMLEEKHPGHASDWSAIPMAWALTLLMPS